MLHFALAFAIALAPAAQIYAAPTPSAPPTINQRIKVWASNLKKVFKFKNAQGETVDAAVTVTVIEGNDEVATVGEIMDQSRGDVFIVHDESDRALVERVEEGPNAANIHPVQIAPVQNRLSWAHKFKAAVGQKWDNAKKATKNFFNLGNESFRGVLVSAAGGLAGFGMTMYFTNESIVTGAALSGILFATGILQNSDYWFKILHAGSQGAKAFMTGTTRSTLVNKIMSGLRKYTVPKETVIRRTGSFVTAVAVNMIPTSMVFAMTDSYILSAGMLFASLRNSWDTPVDITIHSLLEKGRISYKGSKRMMQVKSFIAPVIDNAAASGIPVAQVIAFTLAGMGAYMMYFTDHAEEQMMKSKPVVRQIAAKGKQAGLAVVHSFGGGRKRAARIQQTAIEAHVSRCSALLSGERSYADLSPSWAGRVAPDDIQ